MPQHEKDTPTEEKTGDAAKTKTPAPALNFMTATVIKVPLTYLCFEPAAELAFYCKIIMSEAEKEIRQKHFARPLSEQAAARHAYNVEMLSKISTRIPTGFPFLDDDFDEWYSANNNPELTHAVYVEQSILEYFGAETPMNVRVCDDAMNYYTTILQPAEFFR